jgi:hypothetical protein
MLNFSLQIFFALKMSFLAHGFDRFHFFVVIGRSINEQWVQSEHAWTEGKLMPKYRGRELAAPRYRVYIPQRYDGRKGLTFRGPKRPGISTDEQTNKTDSVGLNPQANCTDWATATCRRNLVPTFVDRWVSRDQRGGSPTVVNLSFLDRSRYFSFK